MRRSTPPRESLTHTGSSFDDFLDEAAINNEVEDAAIKKVLAWQSQSLVPTQKLARRA
jgi:antitoxin HicB